MSTGEETHVSRPIEVVSPVHVLSTGSVGADIDEAAEAAAAHDGAPSRISRPMRDSERLSVSLVRSPSPHPVSLESCLIMFWVYQGKSMSQGTMGGGAEVRRSRLVI